MMKYLRKQTYLTPEQDQMLKHLARVKGVTEAHVLREAVESYLAASGSRGDRDPLWEMVGIVKTSRGSGSTSHDSIYGR